MRGDLIALPDGFGKIGIGLGFLLCLWGIPKGDEFLLSGELVGTGLGFVFSKAMGLLRGSFCCPPMWGLSLGFMMSRGTGLSRVGGTSKAGLCTKIGLGDERDDAESGVNVGLGEVREAASCGLGVTKPRDKTGTGLIVVGIGLSLGNTNGLSLMI